MDLSIVATMYCSARYVETFLERISETARSITENFEIILVDDGSPDESLEIAKRLCGEYEDLTVVELSKNHGHHRAMMIGLAQSCGEFVYLTDIDLEEPPEILTKFWETHLNNPEIDVIFGVESKKDRPFVRKKLSGFFYAFFNALSTIKISDRELLSRLMNRNFVQNLLRYREHSLFLPAVWTDTGFQQLSIEAPKTFDGFTTYSLKKRITLAVDALTSFSAKPLVYVFYSGISISILAMFTIAYLVVQKLIIGTPLLGWTSLIATIFLMGGLILFSLGVIGIYISKIYLEVKSRPTEIIRAIHTNQAADNQTAQRDI
ncbi:MAG: glycosyltransferase family 2 protein [Xanthomonadales bacterium]|nr:glycosyltransferase family 2 protein [Gammaproteobacteria bacterium]MBT8056352.1 glycosyltransferase family 2 protein [Gammaproteobacteria bacterium]NNL04413.1 glycosyltransferase family 2 protein [Xanthomonadales bacterium]